MPGIRRSRDAFGACPLINNGREEGATFGIRDFHLKARLACE